MAMTLNERRARDAERKRERWKSDPAYRDRQRGRKRERARRSAPSRHSKRGERGERAPRVPAAPFVEWLRAYMVRTGLTDATATAESLGICERRVRCLLAGGQEQVTIDVVDQALLSCYFVIPVAGVMVLTLDELYPLAAAA
jgi:hypothetical protein